MAVYIIGFVMVSSIIAIMHLISECKHAFSVPNDEAVGYGPLCTDLHRSRWAWSIRVGT
jgi:hypothetical protein